MCLVTIIGAGDMGSALTVPLSDNGNEVRLVGTQLDINIIDSLRKRENHPRLQCRLPKSVSLFNIDELEKAMNAAEIVVMAITSDALVEVFKNVIPFLKEDMTVAIVSKGFDYDKFGNIDILCNVLEELLPEHLEKSIHFAAIGGPCKANEVVLRSLTYATHASNDINISYKMKKAFETEFYRVEVSDDMIGTEVCSAIKNGYAIGLGICDGLLRKEGKPFNNLRSALFYLSIKEMSILVNAMGGKDKSILGFPGLGDLDVTAKAGRNKIFGETIGIGLPVNETIDKMKKEKITVEGYLAVKFAYLISCDLEKQGKLSLDELPLLKGLYKILYENNDPLHVLSNVYRLD